ncbi:MAG: tetratricopeptide repeat protein [Planctomycetia bacterium]|nr:tetratricopeptide repeat protein [Planctomycetia bacterium]
MTCQGCGQENPATSRFCGACGQPLAAAAPAANCPRCRAPNPPGCRFCNQCGSRLGTATFEDDGKERRVVTVLFADVSGFTSLAEKLDPEEVEERIRACWARLTPVVERHGGYVDKYIGDAVMVLFGAPTAHEDDPERAVRCSLALHQALRDDRLRLRIGVHTGEVIVGSVSDRGEKDYTAMGDTVNTASRLHTHTLPGRTVISAATQRLVEGKFAVRGLEPMKVKGKEEAIRAFEVAGPAPRLGRAAGAATAFVGRAPEIARLDGLLEKARATQQMAVVGISGAPGVGKARLLAEWRKRAAASWPEAAFLSGEAVPYGGEPCRAVRAAVLGRYGEEAEPAELLPALAEDLAAGGDRNPELSAGFIGRLFGIESGTRVRHLDPRDVRAAAFAALRNLLVGLARRGPVVFVLHELQWADSATADFVENLRKSPLPAPLVLVLVARPEGFRERPQIADVERFDLAPLSPAETDELIRTILGGRTLPADLADLLHRRSEGNAFFLEEMLRSLVEDGALAEDQDVELDGDGLALKPSRTLRLARPLEEVRLPHTVQGVVTARIDSLPEDARKVLKAAAVAGRSFSRSILERVLERGVDEALAELLRRDLIQERPPATPGDRDFVFAHALIPEVAYREILRRNRKALHRGIAEALEERLGPRRPLDLLASAANHFEQADVRDRAVTLFLEAAGRARQIYANQEALHCYARVLAMEERPEALRGRAEVLSHLGRHAEALSDHRRLKELFAREGDAASRRAAENGIVHTLASMERLDDAEAEARRIAAESAAAGDTAAEVAALNTLGVVMAKSKRDGEAEEAWKRCEAAARKSDDRRTAAAALNNLGLLAMRRQALEEARRLFEESMALEKEVGNRPGVIVSLTNLAEIHARLKAEPQAIATYQEAIRLCREIGLVYGLGICLNNLANIHARGCRYREAQETYNQALALRREMGDRSGVATTLGNAAIIRHLLGDLAGALTALDAALALARATRQQRVLAGVLDTRANLARLAGDFESAERDHREAAAIDPSRAADCAFSLALDLLEAGRRDEALKLARTLPPGFSLQVRAVAGDSAAAAEVLAIPPTPTPEGVVWTAAAAACGTSSAEPALRRFAAEVDSLGLAGIAWRVRADLAALSGSRADAETALREAGRLATQLPAGKGPLLERHPALARCRSLLAQAR